MFFFASHFTPNSAQAPPNGRLARTPPPGRILRTRRRIFQISGKSRPPGPRSRRSRRSRGVGLIYIIVPNCPLSLLRVVSSPPGVRTRAGGRRGSPTRAIGVNRAPNLPKRILGGRVNRKFSTRSREGGRPAGPAGRLPKENLEGTLPSSPHGPRGGVWGA